MSPAVGVDVGGTKIVACVADVTSGKVLAHETVAAQPERGGSEVLSDAASLVRRLVAGASPVSVGIGICELVDGDGRITSAYTFDWRDLDVRRAFGDVAVVRVASDVRAAALAEARFGAGRDVSEPWLYLSVGTGISFCLVVGGQPYAGAHGNALLVGAPMVERVSSGLALQRAAGYASAEEVFADARCADLVAHAATALGLALASLVNALDPALVVVGGGLGLVDRYRQAAVEAMRAAVELDVSRRVLVLPAALGALGGALGAALVGAG